MDILCNFALAFGAATGFGARETKNGEDKKNVSIKPKTIKLA